MFSLSLDSELEISIFSLNIRTDIFEHSLSHEFIFRDFKRHTLEL